MFKSKRCCLTRRGFGLNVAPMIMKSVVSAIVEQDDKMKKATSTYLDDIFVDDNVVNMEYIRKHFSKYGLKSKDGERIDGSGAGVLGLTGKKVGGNLLWSRGNRLEKIPRKLSRRTVFSICGQIVSHLPVCCWLLVDLDDLARREWEVHGDEGKVWFNVSYVCCSMALGALVQIGGVTVEDAIWLRKDRLEVHITWQSWTPYHAVLTWLWLGSSTNSSCSQTL